MKTRPVCVLLVAAVLGVMIVPASQAEIMRVDRPSELYEAFADTWMFESVGCVWSYREDEGWYGASGVLIDPWWILTAGHNVVDRNEGVFEGSVTDMRITMGANSFYYDEMVIAEEWFGYPGYTDAAPSGTGVDLGLVHLSEPLYGYEPAERYRGTGDLRNTVAYMSGYGCPGTPITGPGDYDYLKRAGSNIIEYFGYETPGVDDHFMMTVLDHPSDPGQQDLEWHTSPGDSGCGWFNEFGELIGINSFARGGYTYFSESGAGMLDEFNPWIDSYVVPEPATLSLLLFGAMFIGHRRRHLTLQH